MNSPIKQSFIRSVFDFLNDDEYSYGILRNYQQLPEISGDDIDIYLDVDDLHDFVSLNLEPYINSLDWKLKYKYVSHKFISVFCYSKQGDELETLQLDFFNAFDWRGISFLDIDHMKAYCRMVNGFRVVAPGSEIALTFTKELLGYGFVRAKHMRRFEEVFESAETDFKLTILPEYRAVIFGLFQEYLLESTTDRAKTVVRRLKASMVLRNPARFLRGTINSIVKYSLRIFRKKQMVVFVGPDGSGKSTLIENFKDSIDRLFPDNIYSYHRRYNILPDLKTNRGFSSMKGQVKPGSDVKVKRSVLSIVASLAVVGYYTLEFVLGNFAVQKNRLRGSLIVYDRYYYDHFIQPTSRDLISAIRGPLCLFIAEPTLIVHLRASGDEIYKRKQDLSAAEIDIQNSYIDKVLSGKKNVLTLDSVKLSARELNVELFFHAMDVLTPYK